MHFHSFSSIKRSLAPWLAAKEKAGTRMLRAVLLLLLAPVVEGVTAAADLYEPGICTPLPSHGVNLSTERKFCTHVCSLFCSARTVCQWPRGRSESLQ